MSNFTFLTPDDPQLARLAARAELYCHDDPNTALVKLRQFAERLARCAAVRVALTAGPGPELAGLIRELEYRGAISREVAQAFDFIRKRGNDAAHGVGGTTGDAVHYSRGYRSGDGDGERKSLLENT